MIAPALAASIAIILLSLISEDAATISSALSIFGGPIAWPLGFAACFAGIWLGDLGLYSIARCGGRQILRSRWLGRFADSANIERCAQAFSKHGSVALIISRFVPGTRLPTYLAAGLFGMPIRRFAFITAFAALVWIAGIFIIATILGKHVLMWLGSWHSKMATIMVIALFLSGALIVFRKLSRAAVAGVADPGRPWLQINQEGRRHRSEPDWHSRLQQLQLPAWLRRWKHWEFWPAWLFYLPVAIYYLALSIRYRSFTLPTAANPGIPTGGFVGESKVEILDQLDRVDTDLVADAYLVEGWTTTDRLLSLHRICRQHNVSTPFILKPDVGQRGNGVRLIRSMREALEYLLQVDSPVIIQRYAAGQFEAGVFYFRMPGETHGQIFSITEKIFPVIRGDGMQTVEQLIRADARASIIARTYLRRFADRRSEILAEGEVLKLVEAGNHAQGCIFRDGGRLWSEDLERKIDDVSKGLPGFYFGRFDIRYDNEQDFRAGRNFKIVELNGASSEATSIYDERTSLRSAYKVLFRQWKLAFEIGAANRARGKSPSSLAILWREWRNYSAMALSYPAAS